MNGRFCYIPLLRPASFSTLPSGLDWEYVEVPPSLAGSRPDLPTSTHTHGVIATRRLLTPDELDRYSLRRTE